jgi:DNA-binding CsgD family transcriptional regulator
MTPKIAKKVINFFQRRSGVFDNLTKRESDVAHGILEGLSYKLIADKYDISIDNVRMNVKKIYRKLNINSKAELFKIAQTKI